MTKIYLAENFLEADQIISELEANHIFAKKHEIIKTSITARMAKPVFEIYVDDKNVEKAVEIIKQMSLSDSSVKSRRMGHRIAALIMVGVVAVGICLSIIL